MHVRRILNYNMYNKQMYFVLLVVWLYKYILAIYGICVTCTRDFAPMFPFFTHRVIYQLYCTDSVI
jgi:hypothetical protein